MPKNQGRHRRDRRYFAAVERQVALRERFDTGRSDYMYAPVEDFLRPGHTVEQFTDGGDDE